jgi:hypothetical protein
VLAFYLADAFLYSYFFTFARDAHDGCCPSPVFAIHCLREFRYVYLDPDEYEDEYGRRCGTPYIALDMRPCHMCNGHFCVRCTTTCRTCEKVACSSHCTHKSPCCDCKHTLENCDDSDIGPQNRSADTCDECWAKGTSCGCGEDSCTHLHRPCPSDAERDAESDGCPSDDCPAD